MLRGGRAVLGPIDWTVMDGQRWVVLGANGAGKTTLLGLCAGSVVPDAGAMTLLGESLHDPETDLDDVLPRIGWSSAALTDQLDPAAAVVEVVVGGLFASLTVSVGEAAEHDLTAAYGELARVGCTALAHRRFGTLSEGERKRVLLARSLIADPELLLLDEPAAGLDLGGREALLRLLTRLARDPAAPAMVMVSHHVEEIPVGFTHALLLRAGRTVAVGRLDHVITSGALTTAFGLPLAVSRERGRFAARALLGTPDAE